MHSDTSTPEPISTPARRVVAAAFEVAEIVRKSVTVLRGMELDGLIETQDGDTYRITEKGKAQAALHREGRV